MTGYTYSSKTISAWPWDAQAVTYRQLFENEQRNCALWEAKYNALVKDAEQ